VAMKIYLDACAFSKNIILPTRKVEKLLKNK